MPVRVLALAFSVWMVCCLVLATTAATTLSDTDRTPSDTDGIALDSTDFSGSSSQMALDFQGWTQCYPPEAAADVAVEIVSARPVVTVHGAVGVEVAVLGEVKTAILGGSYTISIWHESGSRIRYKGPYDLCFNFFRPTLLSNDTSPTTPDEKLGSCPVPVGRFEARLTKPLHVDSLGHYEVDLSIKNLAGEEIVCVVSSFRLTNRTMEALFPPAELKAADTDSENNATTQEPQEKEVFLLSS